MSKKVHAAFAKRLHAAPEAARVDVSPSSLEKTLARCGVSVTPQGISSWLGGRHLPRPEAMQALAFIAGVEPAWLQFGKPARGVGEDRTAWPTGLGGEDRLAFESYLSLPDAQQKLVRELIHTLAGLTAKRGD